MVIIAGFAFWRILAGTGSGEAGRDADPTSPVGFVAENQWTPTAIVPTIDTPESVATSNPAVATVSPAPSATATPFPTATATPTDSPTAPPTPTSTPTATSVPTAEQMETSAVWAYQFLQPPMIDGQPDEWAGWPQFAASHLVYSWSDWDGSADLDAWWQLGWDSDNFYLMARIMDDIHVQQETGVLMFQGDSLELQVDTDLLGDASLSRLSPDDFQIILSPGNFETLPPESFRTTGGVDGTITAAPGQQIRLAAIRTGEGYMLEAAIPWSDLLLVPQEGMMLGIALNVTDNDLLGESRQEVMLSHTPERTLLNPQSWGTLTLLGEKP